MLKCRSFGAFFIAGCCLVACDGVPKPEGAPSPGQKPSKVGTISTVVGTGVRGFSGDGGPAVDAEINQPYGIAFDQAGNLYFSDHLNHRIRKVDRHGNISTFLYDYVPGKPWIGAYALTFDRVGNLYIANSDDVVRKRDANGRLSVFAGGHNVYPGVYPGTVSDNSSQPSSPPPTPAPGSEGAAIGDGGLATLAGVQATDLATDSFGNLFVADYGYNRVRKVDTSGTITTVAGSGPVTPIPIKGGDVDFSFGGDEGPATKALFYNIGGITLDQKGRIFVVANNRLRMIDENGIVHTVSGNGEVRHSGDDGPALGATFKGIGFVAAETQGNIFVSTRERIRKIDTSRIITTIAGTGEYGFSGDGGLATQAMLKNPYSIAIGPDNNLYFVDGDNNRIRKVVLVDGE